MQIAALMGVVGWKPPVGKDAATRFYDIAIAIALAESQGNTRAVSDTGDYGLWQIHVKSHDIKVRQAIFVWKRKSPKDAKVDIFDPRVNTDVARMVYEEAHGFKPWATYNNGSYKKYLGHGSEAVAMLGSADLKGATLKELAGFMAKLGLKGAEMTLPVGSATGIDLGLNSDSLDNLKDAVTGNLNPADKVLSFAKQAGLVVGVFLVGLVIIILGLVWLLKKPIANAAIDVAVPGGKLAKSALKAAK
jgi:hypothetical protein